MRGWITVHVQMRMVKRVVLMMVQVPRLESSGTQPTRWVSWDE
jgi:hypothetical protein